MSVQTEAELAIEAIATGGDGVARWPDGRVAFVPGTAPGDRVRARLAVDAGNLVRAEVSELLEASPGRVEPRCPVYSRCGGCTFQHLSPSAQLEAKARIVADHLVRPGHVPAERLRPVLPSPDWWGYRARMRFHARDGTIGLFARGSRALVPLSGCPIAAPELEAGLAALAPRIARAPTALIEVELAARDGRADLLLVAVEASDDDVRALAGACASTSAFEEIVASSARGRWVVRRATTPSESESPLGSFRQANPSANRVLKREVVGAIGAPRPAGVLELFAGSGNLTFALAAAGHRVVAVENDRHAVAAGQAAARRNGADVVLRQAGAARFLREDRAWRSHAQIVVNPPRAGLPAKLPRALAFGAAERVVYVSCNPATLGRDVARFQGAGFETTQVQPIDLFPQTAHVECVAVLDRTRR